MRSTVTLTEGMTFDTAIDGHHFDIDAAEEHGGQNRGPSPKSLVLAGLAGCASMDIISILRKMRQEPASLSVEAEAEVTEEHPKVFTDITVTVTATGGIKPAKLWRAVALSRDKYCGVSAMLQEQRAVTYVVVLDGETLPEPA